MAMSALSFGAWIRSEFSPAAMQTSGAPRISVRSASGPLPPSRATMASMPNARSTAVTGAGRRPRLLARRPPNQLPLLRGQAHHLVVDPGERAPAAGVVQAREQPGHRVQRVGHATAERARVQVGLWPAQRDLR